MALFPFFTQPKVEFKDPYPKIPGEMKTYRQWVVWRLEDCGGIKPTKIPYNPLNPCGHASVTNPSTWGNYQDACKALVANKFSGIGFVLTKSDPFCFIDLDHTQNQEILDLQIRIWKSFASYSERSPSQKGAHIICKGAIPKGARRNDMEIYTSERYMCMTGDALEGTQEIVERQEYVAMLWEELSGRQTPVAPQPSDNAVTPVVAAAHNDNLECYTDVQVLEMASKAKNGELFEALWNNDQLDQYPQYCHSGVIGRFDQSRADQALCNLLAFYARNREQTWRLFRKSGLGQRDKATRPHYKQLTINKAFDQIISDADVDLQKERMNDFLQATQAKDAATKITNETPKELTINHEQAGFKQIPGCKYNFPPGLVGEIAEFIMGAATMPVPEIALVSAIGMMAGICGRQWNVSNTGLNQYMILLASTGVGKEGMLAGMTHLQNAIIANNVVKGDTWLGAGSFTSAPALLADMADDAGSHCFVSLFGEFSKTLENWSNARLPNSVGLKNSVLDIYQKSGHGNILQKSSYSKKENNIKAIKQPTLSILGETNPEAFKERLDRDIVTSGLLPRFLIFEYTGLRVDNNDDPITVPSQRLMDKLAGLLSSRNSLHDKNLSVQVEQTIDVKIRFKEYAKQCTDYINSAGMDEFTRNLHNRSHLKALKLAALIAVGINDSNPIITLEIADWAIDIVDRDVAKIKSTFEKGEAGSPVNDITQELDVLSIVKNYFSKPVGGEFRKFEDLKSKGFIPYRIISVAASKKRSFAEDRRAGKRNSLESVIKSLIKQGMLNEITLKDSANNKTGYKGSLYQVNLDDLAKS